MVERLEFWAFAVANAFLFATSSVLAGLSYVAYRRSGGQRSLGIAAVGFGLVVLGGLVEPVYQVGVRGDFLLDAEELLLLQTGEGVLIASGLGLLFYAVTRHDAAAEAVADDPVAVEEAAATAEEDPFDLGF